MALMAYNSVITMRTSWNLVGNPLNQVDLCLQIRLLRLGKGVGEEEKQKQLKIKS